MAAYVGSCGKGVQIHLCRYAGAPNKLHSGKSAGDRGAGQVPRKGITGGRNCMYKSKLLRQITNQAAQGNENIKKVVRSEKIRGKEPR